MLHGAFSVLLRFLGGGDKKDERTHSVQRKKKIEIEREN